MELKTYYVVALDGTPVGVSTIYSIAAQMASQMETSRKKAVIIPTMEIAGEFESEEPTEPEVLWQTRNVTQP